MKCQLRSFVFAACTALALLATLTTAAVAEPRAQLASTSAPAAGPSSSLAAPAAATCTKLQAPQGVYWVDLADDGSIQDTVTSYPSGVLTVTAAFDYTCVPNKTTVTTIWSVNGDTILTSKTNVKANSTSGTQTYWIFNNDGSPLSDGDYGVQFYVGQNLIATGDITVGNDSANTVTTPTDVAVQGTVIDSISKKPINGAVVIVLKPNLDITNYLLFGAKSDQVAYAKTNSKGEFTLDNRISVDVGYPWIIGAKGYRSIPDPVFTITQQLATDPYSMTISLDSAR
jgi:hypothetical protein